MRLGVAAGEGALARALAEAGEAAGARTTQGSPSEVADADVDAAVAVGESALLDLVRSGVQVPVLPVEAGPGYGDVTEADARSAVESLLADDWETERRAVVRASVDGDPAGRALADATLVTSEPARISEYAVRSGGRQVGAFRADGVVVSTPTGSRGYGRRAGGPVLEPGSGVVAVTPIAPFAVAVDRWVLSAEDPVVLTVERDEGTVSLLLDDRTAGTVPAHAPVEVTSDGSVTLVRVAGSRPFFEG